MDAARKWCCGTWFCGAKFLFLVDDIWHVNGIGCDNLSTFKSTLSDEYCLVYTTRDQTFKDFSDRVINFESRDSVLAARMLRTHRGFGDSDVPMSKENANAFQTVLDDCAGLPLALGIAGASIRGIFDKKNKNQKKNLLGRLCSDTVSEARRHHIRHLITVD